MACSTLYHIMFFSCITATAAKRLILPREDWFIQTRLVLCFRKHTVQRASQRLSYALAATLGLTTTIKSYLRFVSGSSPIFTLKVEAECKSGTKRTCVFRSIWKGKKGLAKIPRWTCVSRPAANLPLIWYYRFRTGYYGVKGDLGGFPIRQLDRDSLSFGNLGFRI